MLRAVMPFPFYRRLSKKGQAIYRKSDAVPTIALPGVETMRPLAEAIRAALESEDRIAVEQASHDLVAAMGKALGVGPVSVRVLATRPRSRGSELHGLYVREEGERPYLQVWMRTAAHKRVVAFRTFLRTLLHEVGHHLDYELLRLDDSLHTEGFYRRESSMFRQLVPAAEPTETAPVEAPAPPAQTSLPWR